MGINNFVFLEGFKCAKRSSGDVASLIVIAYVSGDTLSILVIYHCSWAFDEVHPICVNDAVVLAAYSEVVGDEFNWAFERGCHP